MKPSFIIIGGVKCASTSLFRYLIDHPSVLPGAYKEPGFFNNKSLLKAFVRYPKYLTNFPPKKSRDNSLLNWPILDPGGKIIETTFEKERRKGQVYITGEASATYNFAADPSVIKTLLPKVKIIFLLREPTKRFISHWRMFQRFTNEGRSGYNMGELIPSIEQEIKAFNSGLGARLIHQGLYYEIINKWKKHFDSDQFLILKSKDLENPKKALLLMEEVRCFLNLPAYDFSKIVSEKFNVAPKKENDKDAEALLNSFYEESNNLLSEHLNIEL